MAQHWQQSPKLVVCLFSPADAHIAICDPQRLPGLKATIRVCDCARVILKVLRDGHHHALLLQAWLKDHARAARPGVWPKAALLPVGLELQLEVPSTVYHWLEAFQDLRWRRKPNCQIAPKNWQQWLQADTQHTAIRGLGSAPTARALHVSPPGCTLAPHTVPLANLPFQPPPESSVRKSVPLPLARGALQPANCPLGADKFCTSGAIMEHLAWHAVHAAAPAEDREAVSHILQGRARRSPWHAPYAQRAPPPPAPSDAAAPEGGEAAAAALPEEGLPLADANPGDGNVASQGSIPAGLAAAPLWAPLGVGSPHPLAPPSPRDLAAPADPAALPAVRDS